MPDPPDAARAGGRGQSPVVAVVLLFGLSTAVVGVLLLAGGPAVDEVERSGQVAHAENELREFDARASEVAYGESATADAEFDHVATDDRTVYRRDGAWLRVRVVAHRNVVDVANVSLGTVVYERGRTELAYQGGGIWRADGDRAVMRSPPAVSYEDGTLQVDALSVGGDTALSGPTRLSREGRRRAFPVRGGTDGDGGDDDTWSGRTNPFGTGTVVVTVHSDYYGAWGEFFEDRIGGFVQYDHGNETVRMWFASNRGRTVRTGVIATSRSGRLELDGNGAYVDSYNSSLGDYASTLTSNGTVEAVGDVNITGNGAIAGNIDAGDVVYLNGSSTVYGDVNWTDDYENGTTTTVTGTTREIDGVPSMPPIDGAVYDTVAHVRRDNDNDATGTITDERLSITGDSAELGAGRYYLDHLNLSGETLVLNTSDGDVTLAVRDWIHLEKDSGDDGNISVTGDGQVRVFVASREEITSPATGGGTRNVNLHLGKGTTVTVPDQRSNRLWVFGPRDFRANVAGDNSQNNKPTFDGVLYAPAGDDGSGYVYVMQGRVFGAVVTGELTLGQNGLVHYDRGLPRTTVYRPPSRGIEYLHAGVYRVNATS